MTTDSPRPRFRAPWGRELMVMSGISLFVVGVPTFSQWYQGHFVIGSVLLAILLIPITLTVRGYEVAPRELRIRRLCWDTRWPIDGLAGARLRPDVMAGSWRIWGNGGMFGFTGRFSNAALGRYRAYVTDHKRTVVLDTPQGILVVSPDRPERFIAAVMDASADSPRL